MKGYQFLDHKGTFYLEQPESNSYLYFPIAGEQGVKGAITPSLGGDLKLGQNQFILQPVSAEELHNNKSTRNFWCTLKDNRIWSATGVSSEEMSKRFTTEQEESSLEAGIMWHRMTRVSDKFKLKSIITSFVPLSDDQVEIMLVELRNYGKERITFLPTAAIPMFGRSADNIRDHRHVTSLLHRIKTTDYGVSVTPTLSFDERGHQKNDTTYFVMGVTQEGGKPEGFYPVVENYIGEGGSYEWPEAIIKNMPVIKTGEAIDGFEAMGAIRFPEVTLEPMETRSYIIVIGACSENVNADQIIGSYNSKSKVLQKLDETKQYWDQKCNVAYHTADHDFDNLMYWVNFQPILRRIYGCSFLPHHDYGKGGRGWRDLWQDCLALLIMEPENVRKLLINNYSGVRIDGTNATIIGNQPGEFIADRNNITRVWMDHGVWPLLTTNLYIDQTGDIGILLKETSYFKDRQVIRGTAVDELWKSEEGSRLLDQKGNPYYGTILEHLLLQNLTAFYEVGIHNHIRLRDADWNDALDMAGELGESVAFTAAYAGNLELLAELISCLKEEHQTDTIAIAKEMELLLKDDLLLYEDVQKKVELLQQYATSCSHKISGEKMILSANQVITSLHHKAEWIKDHIRKTEWVQDTKENGWYNGYYDNHGRQVEGCFQEEIRMMLTSQVFTIMSGTATDEQVERIAASANEYLYRQEMGGYRLNTDFKEVKTDLGRMFGFAYGHKENGAVFSHMSIMYANALYQRGFVKEGYMAIASLYHQALDFDHSRIYPGVPEYFNLEGRGMYHYLTGSASWMMLTVIREMFGVKGKRGNLHLEPKLLAKQFDQDQKVQIELNFRDRSWRICYCNTGRQDYGNYCISSLYLDGEEIKLTQQMAIISYERIDQLTVDMTHEVIVNLDEIAKELR